MGRGKAGWIKDPALDSGDFVLPPIVVAMVLSEDDILIHGPQLLPIDPAPDAGFG